jgi:hypothetical protein
MKSDSHQSQEITPPSALTAPQKALWWLKQGHFTLGAEWEKAHAICQTAEGTYDYDLVHALAHWIEGDEGNRDYWYARVAPSVRAETIEAEWQRIADALAK